MRIFIAALIPEKIKAEMKKYVDQIKPAWEGVKWEDNEKLHLTLKFLGEVAETKVIEIQNVIQSAAQKYSPFEMEISRFGGFPDLRNPRVLFIGLSENQELLQLQEEIENSLERIGFEKERRRFHPHVTVGRIKDRSRLKAALPIPTHLSFSISDIAVMRSVLNSQGSKYSPVSVVRLSQ